MREKILLGFFKKRIFPYKGNVFKTKEEKSKDEPDEESEKERIKKCIKYIKNESTGINYDFLKDYFDFSVPSALAKKII